MSGHAGYVRLFSLQILPHMIPLNAREVVLSRIRQDQRIHAMELMIIPSDTTDDRLIAMWLHNRSPRTQRAYIADARAFLTFAGAPLRSVTLADVQGYQDALADLATASQARRISAVKSLLTFAHRVGYTVMNVGAPVKAPKVKDTLAERILSEADIARVLALETNKRNHAILRLLYGGGLRASEAADLCWHDLMPNGDAGQVTVFGKGEKTRAVLLSGETWRELLALRDMSGHRAGDADPVFRSRKHGPITAAQIWRIVKAAAKRAGVKPGMSPHWLRHAHASHAMDRGAPAHVVRDTLGHASIATTNRYAHVRPTESSSRYLPV